MLLSSLEKPSQIYPDMCLTTFLSISQTDKIKNLEPKESSLLQRQLLARLSVLTWSSLKLTA